MYRVINRPKFANGHSRVGPRLRPPAQRDEGPSISLKKCGSILTGSGFPYRERTEDGYVLMIDGDVREKVHLLVSLHSHIEYKLYTTKDPRCMCARCRKFKLVSKEDILYYEQELRPQEERRKR